VLRLPGAIRLSSAGLSVRLGLVGASLATGFALATISLPAVDKLQDHVAEHVGVDSH